MIIICLLIIVHGHNKGYLPKDVHSQHYMGPIKWATHTWIVPSPTTTDLIQFQNAHSLCLGWFKFTWYWGISYRTHAKIPLICLFRPSSICHANLNWIVSHSLSGGVCLWKQWSVNPRITPQILDRKNKKCDDTTDSKLAELLVVVLVPLPDQLMQGQELSSRQSHPACNRKEIDQIVEWSELTGDSWWLIVFTIVG